MAGNPNWKTGHSGNPKGRPKHDETMTGLLIRELAANVDIRDTEGRKIKMAKKEMVVKRVIELAMKGDMIAIKYIMDRVDGAPRQIAEVKQENDIRIVLDFDTEGL